MNKYATYGRLDDQPEIIGDAQFLRLDMQTDPATLPPGTVRRSENERFGRLGAQVRGGISRQFSPGSVLVNLRFAGIYRPDNDHDRIALVTKDTLTLFDPLTQIQVQYAFPLGETIEAGAAVDIVQGGVSTGTTPTLYILRGLAKTVLKFNGAAVAVEATFTQADFGIFTQDRMVVNKTRQELIASDFLAFGTWNALTQFQVLKGSDDYLVGFMAYQKDYVLIATRKRFFLAFLDPTVGATGYTGQLLAGTSFLRELTREGGLVGRRAWFNFNGLIWFLSDSAIYAFQPRLDLDLTILGEPISAPIQPILDNLSANYASGAIIASFGYRLYFAMPINPDAIAITDADLVAAPTSAILPFTLPAILGGLTYLASVTTITAHGLVAGDLVQIKNALDPNLNGVFTVLAITSATVFVINTDSTTLIDIGTRATMQRIQTRNNVICVFNSALKSAGNPLGEWESVDRLPNGICADYLFKADAGARTGLWIIDNKLGPCLYELGDEDEIGAAIGGLTLPFALPARLNSIDYESSPIAGRLTSRRYRWGPFAREVRAGAARVTCAAQDEGVMTLTVSSPDTTDYVATKAFDGTVWSDRGIRKPCGKRGLEAELDIVTTGGRPLVRTMEIEMTAAGRVAEE